MSANTKIEWCDATWNPITGCSPASEGCKHCYAARMVNRLPALHGYPLKYIDSEEPQRDPTPFSRLVFHPERLKVPLRWRKPRRIFVGSMTDMFHKKVETEWLKNVFKIVTACPQHIFMMLTKRPENVNRVLYGTYRWNVIPENLWIGVTVESAEHLERVDILRTIPAAKRFISFEPLLGSIPNINLSGINWIIVGCETGPGARPMDQAWAWHLRVNAYQYQRAFFMKKATPRDRTKEDLPEDLRIREVPI
jgi:protein gp37